MLNAINWWNQKYLATSTEGEERRGGGTDLEKGYGDVWPWRPPFHATPVVRKGPISSKRVNSQDPLMRKFGNFSLYSLNFCQNFNSQAPNLEIFSSQAPKFGNFQFTSPLFQRQVSVRKPHTSEIRAAHPCLKKVECPPPRNFTYVRCIMIGMWRPNGWILHKKSVKVGPILTPSPKNLETWVKWVENWVKILVTPLC